MSDQLILPQVFDDLKSKIEEETEVRQNLGKLSDEVEKQNAYALGLLSRIHSLPRAQCKWPLFTPLQIVFSTDQCTGKPLLHDVDEVIQKQVKAINELQELANQHPYYK
jgi:hypothetical protein